MLAHLSADICDDIHRHPAGRNFQSARSGRQPQENLARQENLNPSLSYPKLDRREPVIAMTMREPPDDERDTV